MENELKRVSGRVKVEIADIEIEVLLIENGRRVITETKVFSILGKNRCKAKVDGWPAFICKNLIPFINNELKKDLLITTLYLFLGKKVKAYDVKIIPQVANLYISAYELGSLHKGQRSVLSHSLKLIQELAEKGIMFHIDEATRNQSDN